MLFLLPIFFVLSCGQQQSHSALYEPMDARNNPTTLAGATSQMTYKFKDLPLSGYVDRVWGGNWYPLSQGGTAVRYHNQPSPMDKYDKATGSKAYEWEMESVRAYRNVQWAGHCNGLAAAGIMMEEPTKSVTYNNVKFTPDDVKALLVESWQGSGYIIGDRCDRERVTYDSYGRVVETECRDVNAATFHLALTNYLGLFGKAIVADVDSSRAVWNYAIREYHTVDTAWVASTDAMNQIQQGNAYVFNHEAVDFVKVTISVTYLNFGTRVYSYLLELDQKGNVIGGEWLGNNKREHPDFIWRPLDPKVENPNIDLGVVDDIYRLSF